MRMERKWDVNLVELPPVPPHTPFLSSNIRHNTCDCDLIYTTKWRLIPSKSHTKSSFGNVPLRSIWQNTNVLKSSIFMEQVKCILDRLDAICQNNLDSNLLSKKMKTISRASSLSQVKKTTYSCANKSEVIT